MQSPEAPLVHIPPDTSELSTTTTTNTSSTSSVLLKDEFQPGRALYALTQLRRRHQLCDMQVHKDSASFSVHQAVLAASSPYLLSLLSDSKCDKHHLTLNDPKLSVGALELLIDFMYTSMLRIKPSTVDDLCYASRLLQLDRVEKACLKFISNNLTAQNCIHYLQLSAELENTQLRTNCLNHAAKNIREVSLTPQFLTLSAEDLRTLISNPNLTAPSQQIVLEALLIWMNKDPPNRQKPFCLLLERVKEHSFPLKGDDKVQEILNSPQTNAENVVRSLRACFDRLQRNHKEKTSKTMKNREPDASGGRDDALSPEELKAAPKLEKRVHFKLSDEVCDTYTPSKLPESEQQHKQSTMPENEHLKEKESSREKHHSNNDQNDSDYQKPHVKKSKAQQHNRSSVIFVAGGVTSTANTNSVEKFNSKKGDWAAATALPQKKSHAALVSSGQRLYSIGGFNGTKRLSSMEVYSPQAGQWSNAAPMPTPRSGFGTAVDSHGRIYCIGGYNGSHDLSDVDVYDPSSDQWTPGPSLNQRRSYVQAAAIGDSIYAVGGTERSERLKTVEKLSPTSGHWNHVARLNVSRSRPGVSSVGDHIYAVGGYSGSEHLDSAECYSPASNQWKLIDNMSVPRNSPGTAVHDGRLYVGGGYSGKEVLGSVECYDPRSQQWSGAPAMTDARCDFGMTSLEVSSSGNNNDDDNNITVRDCVGKGRRGGETNRVIELQSTWI